MLILIQDSRDPNVGEGLSGEGKMTLNVLADDGLLMMTGHIVPLDSWKTNFSEKKLKIIGTSTVEYE